MNNINDLRLNNNISNTNKSRNSTGIGDDLPRCLKMKSMI